ncbi:MAG TPA: serine hydrolase domain-containing protein [Vicinamibacterales bacterium]
MRSLAVVLTVALLQLGPSPGELLYGRLEAFLDALRQQAGIPGMTAAVIGSNDIIWERAYGQANPSLQIPALPETPFHLHGVTQVFTAAIVLRCVEEGRLSLQDTVGVYDPAHPLRDMTLAQVLAHAPAPGEPLAPFVSRPDRLNLLQLPIQHCTGVPYREALAQLFERLAMFDSVPGADALVAPELAPPPPLNPFGGPFDPFATVTSGRLQTYAAVLARLAVSPQPVPVGFETAALAAPPAFGPGTGAISTVRDFAKFDVALRQGLLVRPESLAAAWRPQTPGSPHGVGWFVQDYRGTTLVWQYGVGAGSSAFVLTVPARGLTLVLLANGEGLVRSFALDAGDVTVSPFARVFLGLVFP